MQPIELSYRQWINVHPDYRSIIDRIPHVVTYNQGDLMLRPVAFVRAAALRAKPGAGQLPLSGEQAAGS